MTKLAQVRTRNGASFTVAAEHAPRFQALLDDPGWGNYQFDAAQSGGYNPRNIRGTNTPSQHAFGNAIDINWTRNARGTPGDIDPNLARSLATKHGFTWGGDWKNPDPMHFEVARNSPAPMAQRGLTSYAGLGGPPTPPPQPETPPMASGNGILSKKIDPQEELMGILGNQGSQAGWNALMQLGAGIAGGANQGWGPGLGLGLQNASEAMQGGQNQRMKALGLLTDMQQQQQRMALEQQQAATNAPFKAAELANMQSLMRSRDADAATQQQLNQLLFPQGMPTNPIQSQSFNPQAPQQGLQQIGNPMAPQFGGDPNLRMVADDGASSIDAQAQAGAAPEQGGPSGGYDPSAVYSMPGNETVQTPLGPMSRDQARRMGMAFAASGKGDVGKMMMEAAGGGADRLGKTGANKIDLKQIDAINHVSRLNEVGATMKPEYLQIPTRLGMAWSGIKAKFGQIPPKEQADLKAYATARRDAVNNMSRLLNELSGAAVSPQEYQRIIKTQPDAGIGLFDGDDPVSFQGKLEGARKEQYRAIARYNYLRQRGFTGKPWEAMPLEAVDGAIDKRGSEIEAELRKANPTADPLILQQGVKARLKQEFGI
jgi:hypothetical protein